jgi:predicted DNA-binding transcriptional regulator AlpA
MTSTDEHPRISTAEICALARYSTATLWRRIDAGEMPAPIDRGRDGYLFDRRAVLIALDMAPHPEPAPGREDPREVTRAELDAAIARRKQRNKGAAWRERLAKVDPSAAPPTPEVATAVADYPMRMNSREVCELAQFSSFTLWRRIKEGYIPAPIDRGREGYLFDRQAVVVALGLENLTVAERASAARNTNDGQNMSAYVRARRQRAVDNLPPPISRKEGLELAKAQIAAIKERRAKKASGGA